MDLPPLHIDALLARGFKHANVDRRYPSQAIQKFLSYNQAALSFLDVQATMQGVDPQPSLSLLTGAYVGAVPLRMPGNGKQGGDLLVHPRFSSRHVGFSKLTRLMALLDDVIRPERMASLPLASGVLVRPPLYYDAIKYLDLYEQAQLRSWRKFRVQQSEHAFPKSGTQWGAYAKHAAQPEKVLRYPCHDSALVEDHPQRQMLHYVLKLAIDEIGRPTTPQSLRLPALRRADALWQRTKGIGIQPATHITAHASDPPSIKRLKEQAVYLLRQQGSMQGAWRIDMALLYEKYVQHVLQRTMDALQGRLISNPRFVGRGSMPAWGLRHVEPDALLLGADAMVLVDAKYKAHFFNQGAASTLLKESHRNDLHQLLAYCTFAPQTHKAGLLIYPSHLPSHTQFTYKNPYGSQSATVHLVGIPFDADLLMDSRQLLQSILGPLLSTGSRSA